MSNITTAIRHSSLGEKRTCLPPMSSLRTVAASKTVAVALRPLVSAAPSSSWSRVCTATAVVASQYTIPPTNLLQPTSMRWLFENTPQPAPSCASSRFCAATLVFAQRTLTKTYGPLFILDASAHPPLTPTPGRHANLGRIYIQYGRRLRRPRHCGPLPAEGLCGAARKGPPLSGRASRPRRPGPLLCRRRPPPRRRGRDADRPPLGRHRNPRRHPHRSKLRVRALILRC